MVKSFSPSRIFELLSSAFPIILLCKYGIYYLAPLQTFRFLALSIIIYMCSHICKVWNAGEKSFLGEIEKKLEIKSYINTGVQNENNPNA